MEDEMVEAIVATDDSNEDPNNIKGTETSESLTAENIGGGDDQGGGKEKQTTDQESETPEGESPAAGKDEEQQAADGKDSSVKDDDSGDETASPQKSDETNEEYSQRVKKRIGKLTAEKRAAERKAAAIEVENQELRERLNHSGETEDGDGEKQPEGKNQDNKETAGKQQEQQPPKPEDFTDLDDYLVAKAKFEALQEFREEQSQKDEARRKEERDKKESQDIEHAKEEQQKRLEKYRQKMDEGATKYDDFEEVVFGPESPFNDPRINPDLVVSIKESDNPADLAYYFNKHPDEVQRVASLGNPVVIALEVGKLAAQFSNKPDTTAETVTAKPRTSKAPDPITPVNAGSAGGKKDPENMSQDEYNKWAEAQGF